jgi:hypothetical protein
MRTVEYSNPPLPEGVNVSRTHPLLDFARLAAALVAIVVIAVVILALVAERLGWVPFEMEQALAASSATGCHAQWHLGLSAGPPTA